MAVKNYLDSFLFSLWNPVVPCFDETDLPTFMGFSQFDVDYMPLGNLAQDLCTITQTLSHKSCESNNDVLGRIETVMLVISNVESTFNPSFLNKCTSHSGMIPAYAWYSYMKIFEIFWKVYI